MLDKKHDISKYVQNIFSNNGLSWYYHIFFRINIIQCDHSYIWYLFWQPNLTSVWKLSLLTSVFRTHCLEQMITTEYQKYLHNFIWKSTHFSIMNKFQFICSFQRYKLLLLVQQKALSNFNCLHSVNLILVDLIQMLELIPFIFF